MIAAKRKRKRKPDTRLRDELGALAFDGERFPAAHRKLVSLGHIALRQGLSYECTCGRTARIVPSPGEGWIVTGTMTEARCDRVRS